MRYQDLSETLNKRLSLIREKPSREGEPKLSMNWKKKRSFLIERLKVLENRHEGVYRTRTINILAI